MGVSFVGFENQFGCGGTPFFLSVIVPNHEPEQEVEEVLLKRKVEEEELARSRQVWEQAKEEALARKKSEEEGKSEGGERRTAQSSCDSAAGDVSCFTHVHEKQNIKICFFFMFKNTFM